MSGRQHQRNIAARQKAAQRPIDLARILAEQHLLALRALNTTTRSAVVHAGSAHGVTCVLRHAIDLERCCWQIGRNLDETDPALRQCEHVTGVRESNRSQQRFQMQAIGNFHHGLQGVWDAEGADIVGGRQNRQATRLKAPEFCIVDKVVEMPGKRGDPPLVGAYRFELLDRPLGEVLQFDPIAGRFPANRRREKID